MPAANLSSSPETKLRLRTGTGWGITPITTSAPQQALLDFVPSIGIIDNAKYSKIDCPFPEINYGSTYRELEL
jgi:hypothetical protein